MSDAVVECLLDLIAARPARHREPAYSRWESSIGQFIVDLPVQQQAGAAELLAHHLCAQLAGMPLGICELYARELIKKVAVGVGR